jgi:hypothetical protein
MFLFSKFHREEISFYIALIYMVKFVVWEAILCLPINKTPEP